MPVIRVDRFDDPRLAEYRTVTDGELLRRRHRFVAEGRLVVARLLHSGHRVESLLVNEASFRALEELLSRVSPHMPIYVCETEEFAAITGYNLHRGCLALAERPEVRAFEEVMRAADQLLVLEAVTDADNVGSAFRNAAAFGASVLLSEGCCDPLYRKAIRTSMGNTLRTPYARLEHWLRDLATLKSEGFTLVALTPRADAIDLPTCAKKQRQRLALLVGSEGSGLSAEAEALADVCVRIPIAADVDSLNLATATGIALYCFTNHQPPTTNHRDTLNSPMLRRSRETLLAALLVAALAPYFLNLGVSSIWDANEAFYAQTPREMIEAGDYVTPSFNFQLRMNKPVLSYWHVAAAYHLFGISEWSERLPIAIGAVAIIATAFGLGRLLGGTFAGLLAAVVLATSPRLVLLARRIIIDVHITMWTGLVLLCFALAETRPQRRRLYLCLMYVAAGFGVLTKGPVAVFLPAVVFFIYLASQKRLGDLRHMMLPTGAIISLAIVVPWYYFLYREHGWEYIGSFIFGENLGRYAEAVGDQSRGMLFYIPVMLADLFPWSVMIPIALWWTWRHERHDRVARLLLVWIAAIVVFFSLSGTKEDLYILPIVPAEAALIGAMLAKGMESRGVAWATGTTAVMFVALGGAALWVFATNRYPLAGAASIGAAALAGGLVGFVWLFRRRAFASVATLAASVTVVVWCVVLCTLPDFERYKPVRPFSEIIRARASIGAIVGSYRFSLPSMVFYLHRPVMEVVLPDHLRAVFYSSSDVYFIMAEREYNTIKDRLPVETFVLARQPMFDLKPKNFLDGSELQQFVLVSNRD